jgi:hypothetical protein
MATSSIIRTPGDYVIFAPQGGVVIDVNNTTTNIRSPNTGTVTIYGNLDVVGGTTYIETTNTNITDNILVLNNGETNNYVTQGTAGILISRGGNGTTGTAATFLFNDTVYWNYDNITTHRGIWELAVGDGVGPIPSALRVNAIRVSGTQNFLNFLGQENPTAVLNVKGTLDYETRVINDDDIPNKKYVDDRMYTGNETSKKIQVGNTFVKINDNSISPGDQYFSLTNRIFAALGTATNIVFELKENSALLQGITVNDTVISVNGGRGDNSLTLNPYDSTGTVQINSGISLQNIPSPTPRPYSTQVYSTSTTGGGGTGLFYVNTNNTDELVSRKRAIIYGIIF